LKLIDDHESKVEDFKKEHEHESIKTNIDYNIGERWRDGLLQEKKEKDCKNACLTPT
jgi:hypothetical protein